MFGPNTLNAISAHARKEFPKECCGLVIKGNYVPCENVANDPEEEFKISDRMWARAREIGGVQAVHHSHPNGPSHPTYADQEAQLQMPNMPWGLTVLSKTQTRPTFFWGDTVPMAPLEGRSWVMGVHDCYGLVRDFYKAGFNIVLPNRPRKEQWWNDPKEKDLLMRWYEEDGWEHVHDGLKNAQPFDVFLIRFDGFSVPTHCAIYLGREIAIHHRWDRPSCRVPVAPFVSMIERVVRYKGLDHASYRSPV